MKYKITITWSDEDVLYVAEQMKVKLSDAQIVDVLDYVEHKHDANHGISWDTIRYAIESELELADWD